MLSLEKRASVLATLLMGGKKAPSVGMHAAVGGGLGLNVGGYKSLLSFPSNVSAIRKLRQLKSRLELGGAVSLAEINAAAALAKKFGQSSGKEYLAGTGAGVLLGGGVGFARKAKYMKELKRRKLIAALGVGGVGATAGTVAALRRRK